MTEPSPSNLNINDLVSINTAGGPEGGGEAQEEKHPT